MKNEGVEFSTKNVMDVFSNKATLWDNKKQFIFSKVGETARLEKFASKLIHAGMCILEIGVGAGKITKKLVNTKENLNIIGLDISLDMAFKFRENLSEKNVVDVVICDAQNLCFNENSFDCVIMQQVLHHIPKPILVLKEAYRVLKKNGLLLILTVGEQYQNEFFSYQNGSMITDPLGRISQKKLLEILINCKFDIYRAKEDFFTLCFNDLESYYLFMDSIGAVDKFFHYDYKGNKADKKKKFFSFIQKRLHCLNKPSPLIELNGHYITVVVKKNLHN